MSSAFRGERLYRRLMRLYPDSFRRRWEEEMVALAARLAAEAGGSGGRLRLWPRLLFDLVRGALAERFATHGPRRAPHLHPPRRFVMWNGLGRDLGNSWRLLRRAPGHALAVVLTLALGIGANAAVFAVVHAVLLRPLPYLDPERLVLLWEKNPDRGWTRAQAAPANLLDWREQVSSFEEVAGFADWLEQQVLAGDGEAVGVKTMFVVGDLFGVLGTPPALGRSFRFEETWRPEAGVTILSDRLWRQRFGADPGILHRSVMVDGKPLTVVGVMPPGFSLWSAETDLWRPMGWRPESRNEVWFRRAHMIRGVARLRSGVSPGDAGNELAALAARLERQYPETNTHMGAGATSLSTWLIGDARRPLLLLFLAVALVLLVACANVTHLELARASGRRHETALRGCLGASRWRLAREGLLHSLVLGGTGGLAGLLVAGLATPLLVRLGGVDLPRLEEVRVGGAVLAFTVLLALVTAGVSGLLPALRAADVNLETPLRDGGRGGGGRRGMRLRHGLVAAEVALAALVVVGALLLVRSQLELERIDPGYDADGVLTAGLSLPASSYPDRTAVASLLDRLLERVRAIPGVESAGITRSLPTTENAWTSDFAVEGRDREDFGIEVSHREVTPGYFETLKVPLLGGRLFTETDVAGAPFVVVINETLARQHFAGSNPVGQRLCFDRYPDESSVWRTIVGVVGDERQERLAQPARPEILAPLAQDAFNTPYLVVRGGLSPASLTPALRGALAALDRGLPLLEVRTMEEVRAASLGRERFLLTLFALFAGLALVLAAIGIYGVTAQAVAARRREVGVRLALGALASEVVRRLVARSLAPVLAGLAAGGLGALLLARSMTTLLYGIQPADLPSFAASLCLLFVVALAAIWIPVRLASRVAPAEVLRGE